MKLYLPKFIAKIKAIDVIGGFLTLSTICFR
jgi:hypothetical protein